MGNTSRSGFYFRCIIIFFSGTIRLQVFVFLFCILQKLIRAAIYKPNTRSYYGDQEGKRGQDMPRGGEEMSEQASGLGAEEDE